MAKRLNETPNPNELAILMAFNPKALNIKVDYHLESNGAALLPSGMYGLTVKGDSAAVQEFVNNFKAATDRAINERDATVEPPTLPAEPGAVV